MVASFYLFHCPCKEYGVLEDRKIDDSQILTVSLANGVLEEMKIDGSQFLPVSLSMVVLKHPHNVQVQQIQKASLFLQIPERSVSDRQ